MPRGQPCQGPVEGCLGAPGGHHRNRALASARQAKAVELTTEGRTYREIADELGYAYHGIVHRIRHQALAHDRVEAVENLQQLESARLDALQAAIWDKAMNGDAAAAQAVVRVERKLTPRAAVASTRMCLAPRAARHAPRHRHPGLRQQRLIHRRSAARV